MCRFSRCLQRGRRLNSRLSSAEVCASCRLWRIGSSVRIRRNRCRSAGHQNQCAMPAGSRSTNVSAGVGGLAVLCLFPGGEQRDLADLWPADAIVSEMTATGFTDVEAERRHVHRERDLAELWSAVGSASGTHNCCHHRTLGIRAACGASTATSAIRIRPGRAPTICAHRGGRNTVRSRRSVSNIRPGAAARLEDDSRRPGVRAVSAAEDSCGEPDLTGNGLAAMPPALKR
jgi:hypothetical protein